MVKHVILWQLNDELSNEEKNEVKAGIKTGLESLKGKIPGLTDIKVEAAPLASSNADVMLDSTFENEEHIKLCSPSRTCRSGRWKGAPVYKVKGLYGF